MLLDLRSLGRFSKRLPYYEYVRDAIYRKSFGASNLRTQGCQRMPRLIPKSLPGID